jgi:hypothetical protein
LLEDTIERANWHVHPQLSGHRDGARFNRVLKLTVTATGADVPPPVSLKELNDLTDFHIIVPRVSGA